MSYHISVVYLLQDVLFPETGSTLKLLHYDEARLSLSRMHELFHAVLCKPSRVAVHPITFCVDFSRGENKLSAPLADWRGVVELGNSCVD
jgi:hypothetical protein